MWSLISKFQNCFLKANLYLTINKLSKSLLDGGMMLFRSMRSRPIAPKFGLEITNSKIIEGKCPSEIILYNENRLY